MKFLRVILIAFLLFFLFLTVPVLAKEYKLSNYDIRLKLEESGDYLITERITYDFREGKFSWASRDVRGRGFDNLKFISIEGINTNITDYKVSQGNKLNVKWYFPETTGRKKFVIKYRASGGLITRDNENVIDWLAVGKGWQVPIQNLDVEIRLPQSVENIKASPAKDVIKHTDNLVHLSKDNLSAGESYHVTLTFPTIIKTDKTGNTGDISDEFGIAILIGLTAGLLLAVIDILRRKKEKPVKSEFNHNKFSFPQQAVIYTSGRQNKAGIAAQIFNLAKKGKIKLISKVKKGFMGSKSTEIKVEILSETHLAIEDKIIIDKLKEHKNLKKFARDNKVFKQVHAKTKNALYKTGLISTRALNRRKNRYFSSLYFLPVGIAAFIYGSIKGAPPIITLGTSLFVIGIGRLFKGGLTPVLSGEGMYIKEEIQNQLDNKKEKLDKLIMNKKADKALQYFFAQLEYIIIHKNFNSSTLSKYKKVFKEAEQINIPDWIEFDLSNLDKTIDALDMVEIIDYMIVSMLVITSSAGATAGGAGSGGAAGGGGGGAG